MDARIWELDNTSKDAPSYETDDLSEDHFGIRFQPLGQADSGPHTVAPDQEDRADRER
jgi:hypothetical protein